MRTFHDYKAQHTPNPNSSHPEPGKKEDLEIAHRAAAKAHAAHTKKTKKSMTPGSYGADHEIGEINTMRKADEEEAEAKKDEKKEADMEAEAMGENEEGMEDEAEKSYAAIVDDLESGYFQKSSGPFIGARGGKWADAKHTIPWKESKHGGKAAPKSKEHSPESARELVLFTENDGQLYSSQHVPIQKNLANKMANGVYDHAQATKLFSYLMDSASKKYQKDHGTGGGHAFDPATRMAAAKMMANDFHDEALAGDHDDKLNKKNTKAVGSLKSTKKSEAGDMAALGDWLEKAGVPRQEEQAQPIPVEVPDFPADKRNQLAKAAAYKLRLPETHPRVLEAVANAEEIIKAQSMPKGNRKTMDARSGKNAEVGRAEDGGKVAGVGANSGGPTKSGKAGIGAGTKKADEGKLDRLSEDDPKAIEKMKTNDGLIEQPGEKTKGNGADKKYDPINKSYRAPVTAEEINAANREYAMRRQAFATPDISPGIGIAPQPMAKSEAGPVPETKQFGGGLVSNATDLAVSALLEKGDGFYQGQSPTLDNRGELQKSIQCGACGKAKPVWTASCPTCGVGDMRKSGTNVHGEAPKAAQRLNPRRGPVMLHLPNGTKNTKE